MDDPPLGRTWCPEPELPLFSWLPELPEFPSWLPTIPNLWGWWCDSKEDERSAQLVIGGFDPDHYTGDLVYSPVVSSKAWLIAVQRVFVKDQEIKGHMMALVDSGTTLLYLPKQMFNMFSSIGMLGSQDYYFDCAKLHMLPTLTLVISEVKMTLEPSEYVFKVRPGVCDVGIKPSDSDSMFILGDVWMRKYYTVFDMGNHRVGFARAV
ncbi:gastricsin-like [Macrosteles quadrilineatus]|uniref:gastricsin-like n=1 Tax=Macrosteles quadrilineatus TaxID=74068 RepID=UPI0023E325DD|nr:gastricsin-like [Macrosteles quadrilineatus]